jgi:D-alanyl-lipoteichoic acid acyltransferase DltB (MBOAT superfamily)
MILTSLQFMLFAAIILIYYVIIPNKLRWVLLLIASYIFYACFNVPYLLLAISVVTVITYFIGLSIDQSSIQGEKRCLLWLGILLNLSLLIFLKYSHFLIVNLNIFFDIFHTELDLPKNNLFVTIGVSYYVFQAISYLIDVYLEMLEPESHLGHFALYISFFPKLLQGPIERGGNLLPQLRELSPTTSENLHRGINLFIWGLFKKVVIADRLATFVDPIYNNVHDYFGLSFLIATYLFAFQIYFDFSGYTDMAMGIARCFNIGLTQNFNSPYLASSVADFWRRWHISFSSWILDYIFKPLQFALRDWNRLGTIIALMLTFLASGLWHGASWCFIAWGGLHGIYLSVSTLVRKPKQKFYKALNIQKSKVLTMLQIVITFHLICFSWVFFRASSIHDAVYIIRHSLIDMSQSLSMLNNLDTAFVSRLFLGKSVNEFLIAILLVMLTVGVKKINRAFTKHYFIGEDLSFLPATPHWVRGIVYGFACYMIVFYGVNSQSFIYLNF